MDSSVGHTFLVIYLVYMLHLVYDVREKIILEQKTRAMGGTQSLSDFLISLCSDELDKAAHTYKSATGCSAEEAKEFVQSLRTRLVEKATPS